MARLGRDNLRVLLDGGRIIGGLGFYRLGQWFGGRSVSLAGVAGVGVAPEARGRGMAASMCTDLLREVAADGFALAGLFPTTATLYRSVGFEQAGARLTYRAPVASLPRGGYARPCRPVAPADHAVFHALYNARARSWNGHLDRTSSLWERIVTEVPGVMLDAYTVGDPMESYAVLARRPLGSRWFDLVLRDYGYANPSAIARILTLLGDLRSIARHVEWNGCAADPIASLLPEYTCEVVASERWMLRVLDVVRALEARGYPPVTADVHLRVRDSLFAANDGLFVLHVDRGVARVERGGRGDVALDVRGLAAMYSGFAHPHTLVGAGLLEGDAGVLASLFAGPDPWCCDHY